MEVGPYLRHGERDLGRGPAVFDSRRERASGERFGRLPLYHHWLANQVRLPHDRANCLTYRYL